MEAQGLAGLPTVVWRLILGRRSSSSLPPTSLFRTSIPPPPCAPSNWPGPRPHRDPDMGHARTWLEADIAKETPWAVCRSFDSPPLAASPGPCSHPNCAVAGERQAGRVAQARNSQQTAAAPKQPRLGTTGYCQAGRALVCHSGCNPCSRPAAEFVPD